MKRMSYLVMALLLVLSLSACATINRYAPAESAEPSAPSVQETVQPEETDQPEATDEPVQPAAQSGIGNLAGNLNNGGRIIEDESGAVYLAQKDGIYRIQNGESERICEDRAVDLNLWNDRLYYVAQEYSEDGYYDEHVADTLVSIALDGSDRQELGEKRPVRIDSIWPQEPVGSMTYEANTYYCGYTDLNVINGQLYFMANNGRAGSADVTNYYENSQGTIRWDSDKSLYRMELDGSNLIELVADVGNDDPHFCTDGEKLYYAASYTNCFFSYPFAAFYSCDLDGTNVQSLLDGMGGEKSFDCEKGVINEIVDGLFVENGKLYVSASDSEGDFPNTRLMRVDGGETYTYVGDELYGVHTLGDGEGNLIWFRSPEDGTQYVIDDEGVYSDEYVNDAQLLRMQGVDVSGAQTLMEFQHLERWSEEFSYFNMAIFGDHLYVLTDRALYCLDIPTGSEETLLTPIPDYDPNEGLYMGN